MYCQQEVQSLNLGHGDGHGVEDGNTMEMEMQMERNTNIRELSHPPLLPAQVPYHLISADGGVLSLLQDKASTDGDSVLRTTRCHPKVSSLPI